MHGHKIITGMEASLCKYVLPRLYKWLKNDTLCSTDYTVSGVSYNAFCCTEHEGLFFCWLIACCLPPTPFCSSPFAVLSRRDWLCLFLCASRCWVLLSVAVCVGSRGLVQHSGDTLIDTVLGGEIGGGQMPAPAYWRRTERVSSILWWCTCHEGIMITYHKPSFFSQQQPLVRPPFWFTKLSHFLSHRLQTALMSLPLFTHSQAADMQTYLCVHVRYKQSANTLLWKWRERGSHEKEGEKRGGGYDKVTIFGISR